MDKNNLEELRYGFDTIKTIRLKIKDQLISINNTKNHVKNKYINCIQKEKKNFFGLDSVYFQTKLIELEYGNMLKLYSYIDNRIYGDYYKLFFMMNDYLQDKVLPEQYITIKEFKRKRAYPVYKDLDTFKSYDFDIINNIHQDVIHIIKKVYEIYEENESKINARQESLYYGINLDNYIINQKHLNESLMMTNNLHRRYICVYHKLHNDILQNFFQKIELFFRQINNHTIKEDSPTINIKKTISNYEETSAITSKPKPKQKPRLTKCDIKLSELKPNSSENACQET